MRHGWLWLILVCCLRLPVLSLAHAEEMSIVERDSWLARPELSEKVDELMELVTQNQIEALDFSIQSLANPQQEVIRFLLLQRFQDASIQLSIDVENLVATLRLLAPKYHVIEKGDGFEFLSPAFDYPSLAHRLVKEWQFESNSKAFVSSVQLRQLDLELWLTGELEVVEKHQDLLLRSMDQLEPLDIDYLVSQITTPDVVSWLPSNQIMAGLAQASNASSLYKLFWLMRADLYSEQEVARLGEQNTVFALEQLILASRNPRLKQQAQSALAKAFPMQDFVRRYFLIQLNQEGDANFVAGQLIANGYRAWLQELVDVGSKIKYKQVKAELDR
ncbi:hypothetical protein ACXJY6_15875 [Vibrio sp. RC27]